MSVNEIKQFCENTHANQIRVKIRLKNSYQSFSGRIANISVDQFFIVADGAEKELKPVLYSWVAHINRA